MNLLAMLMDKVFVAKVTEAFKAATGAAEDIAEARALLAERLARIAREGDFDDVLRKVRASDDEVADFIENG